MKIRWLAAGLAGGLAFSLFTPLPERIGAWLSRSETGFAKTQPGACPADAPEAKYDFTLKDLHGKDVRLASFKGKVVLLNFWATWCGPCLLEIPSLVQIQESFKDQGFAVLGVSVDDPPEKLPPFATEFKINYPLLVGQDHEDLQEAYGGIFGIPMSFLISRDGKVCRRQIGPASKEQFESWIKALL